MRAAIERIKCRLLSHEYWTGLDANEMPTVVCARCGHAVDFTLHQEEMPEQIALRNVRRHIKDHGPERWYR